jgi:hypothetical protein
MTISVQSRCGSPTPLLTDWTSRRQGSAARAEGDGPPGICAPTDLLKLYIYAYLNRVPA